MRLFLNSISSLVGFLASIRLPKPLNNLLLKTYAQIFSINLDEAEKNIEDYSSLNNFFTRNLKTNTRSVYGDFVSPVDGTLRNTEIINGDLLTQVKTKRYSLSELLEDKNYNFDSGILFNFYLSPRDYHHVHFPCDAQVISITYIPGRLWSVGDLCLKFIPHLFSRNERVIIWLKTKAGMAALVMVGAFNVGKIKLSFDDLITNQDLLNPTGFKRDYAEPKNFKIADKLGTFMLGSSVVLVVDKQTKDFYGLNEYSASKVQYGQELKSL